MKKILLTMLGVLFALPVLARDFTYEYEGQIVNYTVLDEDAKTVSTKEGNWPEAGSSVSGALILPSNPKDGNVEYTLTTIGENAFLGCNSLTSIEIPTSVTSIEYHAFSRCSSLTSVEIPNSVTSIGISSFWGCSSLTSIVVDSENQNYSSSSDGILFNKDFTKLIQYPTGKSGHYAIPNSVTSIREWAFDDCSSLTSVEIPNSVTYIGEGAFYSCSSLTSVEIPNSVTSIRDYTFGGCSNLTSVGIPNTVTYIGYWSFTSCDSLTSLEIPNSVTSIIDCAFWGCIGLTSVEIPNSVTYIGQGAFSWCFSLTSVEIPNSVTYIGDDAFNECNSLTSVYYNSTEPVECPSSIFPNMTYSNGTLYVPEEAVETYQQTWPWNKFQNIQGYTFSTGVEDVSSGIDETLPCEYFNLSGVKMGNTRESLAPGIYIMRQGNATRKIVVTAYSHT